MSFLSDDILTTTEIIANCMNPLVGLTSREIEHLLAQARRGNDVRLQICFQLIEQVMPIFAICLKKRQSAILDRKWDIAPTEDFIGRAEAEQQAKLLKKILQQCEKKSQNGLTQAFEHLCLASFRGRAYVKPFVRDDLSLDLIEVPSWRVLKRGSKSYWLDNPLEFNEDFSSLKEIPEGEVCYTLDSHPVDLPGLAIYLRQLVGETKWAQFVERNGCPKVILEAPEGTSDTELGAWRQRALQIYEGGVGVLPNGTKATELTAARDQDPFSEFCKHQMEMVAILATGGTLATLGGSTGLGSNLTEVQNTQFEMLVTQDCKKIENTLNAVALEKIARKAGQKLMCAFSFIEDEKITPAEYVDLAVKLHGLGATIDLAKLKEVTDLPFIKTSDDGAQDEVWTPREGNE